MAKAYIVTDGCYSSYGISAVFSTREAADRYCGDLQSSDAQVEEYELDEYAEHFRQRVFCSYVEAKNARLYDIPPQEMVVPPHYTHSSPSPYNCSGQSVVSQEHARKLAVEAYQAWLRSQGCEVGTLQVFTGEPHANH